MALAETLISPWLAGTGVIGMMSLSVGLVIRLVVVAKSSTDRAEALAERRVQALVDGVQQQNHQLERALGESRWKHNRCLRLLRQNSIDVPDELL